jgi:hypothetical protein
LSAWLAEQGCTTHVAMEATGVYWSRSGTCCRTASSRQDLTAVSEKARPESAALAKLRKDTAADLADAHAQHAARIERELKDHEQAMTAARVELAAVEKQAADLLAKAKSDAAAAAKARATAERKLAAFEAA